MKRPYFVNFLAIRKHRNISIHAFLSYSKGPPLVSEKSSPVDFISMLRKKSFKLKVQVYNEFDEKIFQSIEETDDLGRIDTTLYLSEKSLKEHKSFELKIYELKTQPGIEFYLGNFQVVEVKEPLNIIISDFDKTLIETHFTKAKDLLKSLTHPLSSFPKIDHSINLIKSYIESKEIYSLFILSASPHFYEYVIRSWLKLYKLNPSGILLKDYRQIMSVFDDLLTTKDLRNQGYYKFTQIVHILKMTGVPQKLILLGDMFESDTLIYLTLVAQLVENMDPPRLWREIKELPPFQVNSRQETRLLDKLYELKNMNRKNAVPEVKIYIRKKPDQVEKKLTSKLLTKYKHYITYYDA